MKALRKTEAGTGLELVDVPRPTPDSDEVLIRVEASSICGTDVHIHNWGDWAAELMEPPTTIGHEYTGRVMEVGESVASLEEGDRISVESHVYCDTCDQCQSGKRHVCQNLELMGVTRDGGFAEYAAVPERCAWKTGSELSPEKRTVHEPVGNAVYATLLDQEESVEGACVVVFGCGPAGLFSVGVARARGARQVLAVENSSYRRDLAQKMGADETLDGRKDDLPATLRDLLENSDGADVVLEMSGHPVAYRNALRVLRGGARLTVFGLPPKDLSVNLADHVIHKGVQVNGIFGRLIFDTWEITDSLIRRGELGVDQVITHSFSLSAFEEAFELLNSQAKEAGKIVLYPET